MKYDYKCDDCEFQFEINQSMKDEAKATCPKCSSVTKNRVITGGSGFILQGGGWYTDGYSNKTKGGNP